MTPDRSVLPCEIRGVQRDNIRDRVGACELYSSIHEKKQSREVPLAAAAYTTAYEQGLWENQGFSATLSLGGVHSPQREYC
jgi:hypothetical protein